MRFFIGFGHQQPKCPLCKNTAILQLGDDEEHFTPPIGFWKRADYEAQWYEACMRLLRGEKRSALITELLHPVKAGYVNSFPLYRKGPTVFVQNRLLFLDQLNGPFDVGNPYRYIGPRTRTVSEWSVDVSAVERFVTTHYETRRRKDSKPS